MSRSFASALASAALACSFFHPAFFPSRARASTAPPSARRSAVGFQVGAPTAIVGAKRLDEARTLVAGFGFSFSDYVSIHGDHLWTVPNPLASQPSPFLKALRPYVGAGARMVSSRDPAVGRKPSDPNDTAVVVNVRVPFGFEWRSVEAPFGAYLEIVPGLYVVPETAFALQGALGARWEF